MHLPFLRPRQKRSQLVYLRFVKPRQNLTFSCIWNARCLVSWEKKKKKGLRGVSKNKKEENFNCLPGALSSLALPQVEQALIWGMAQSSLAGTLHVLVPTISSLLSGALANAWYLLYYNPIWALPSICPMGACSQVSLTHQFFNIVVPTSVGRIFRKSRYQLGYQKLTSSEYHWGNIQADIRGSGYHSSCYLIT